MNQDPEPGSEDQSAPPLAERVLEIVEHRMGVPLPGLQLPQLPIGVLRAGNTFVAVASGRFRVFPGIGWERSARLGVQAAASGAAATGLKLQCLAVSLNVPASTTERQLTDFWRRIHREAGKLEITVASNSTVVGPFGSLPDIGTCVAVAVGEKDPPVTAAGSRAGDLLLLTRCAGIEAAALLALTREQEIVESLGEGFAEDASQMYRGLSTVLEAEAARRAGLGPEGITAMHNVGAAGVLRGIEAMSRASGLGFELDQDLLPLSDDVDAILSHFQVDPLITASQGALLLTCRPGAEGPLGRELDQIGVPCAAIGRVSGDFQGLRIRREGRTLDEGCAHDYRLPVLLSETLREGETWGQ